MMIYVGLNQSFVRDAFLEMSSCSTSYLDPWYKNWAPSLPIVEERGSPFAFLLPFVWTVTLVYLNSISLIVSEN